MNFLIQESQKVKILRVSETLFFLRKKILFGDYNFSFGYIETLRNHPNKSLYYLVELMICYNGNFVLDVCYEFPKTKHIILSLYISFFDICLRKNCFNIEQNTNELLQLYLSMKQEKDDCRHNLQFLFYLVQEKLIQRGISLSDDKIYTDKSHHLYRLCIKYINLERYDVATKYLDTFESLYIKEAYPFIKRFRYSIEMKNKYNISDIDNILQFKYGKIEHLLLHNFYKMDRYILSLKFKHKNNQSELYPLPYIPHYNEFLQYKYKNYIYPFQLQKEKHLKIDYLEYLDNLVSYNSYLLEVSGIINYISILNHLKQYQKISDLHNRVNLFTILKMYTTSLQLVISSLYILLLSQFNSNIYISLEPFNEYNHLFSFLNDKTNTLSPSIQNIIEKILQLRQKIEIKQSYVHNKGYSFSQGSNDDSCMVCLESMTVSMSSIQCNECHKIIGHEKCVFRWLRLSDSCPNCRKT